MPLADEPKIDCHCHVFDPVRFPYRADTFYRPAGQELGTAAQFARVLDAHGVSHALLVGPNSGYETDNRCLLDAIAGGGGRFRGIAVVDRDAGLDELAALRAQGIVGIAFNAALHGTAHYAASGPLLGASNVRLVIDHCGRPVPEVGLGQPGFQALLALGRSGRATVKLSGQVKFSRQGFPHADAQPYVDALLDAFTPDGCVWASDWPFLRAPERIDYGPLLAAAEALLPDAAERRKVLWDTPRRVFGFGDPA